jgi:hypothetical protein
MDWLAHLVSALAHRESAPDGEDLFRRKFMTIGISIRLRNGWRRIANASPRHSNALMQFSHPALPIIALRNI